MMMAAHEAQGGGTGSARRRRERRLRSMLRHERMTVAMALAEKLHHSAQRPEMARAGVWGREMNYTATIRDPPTPQPELFSLYDEEPGGLRPDRMPTLSGPQEQVLRHTVDQIVVAVSALPTFDVPVPQTVDQLVGALLHLDTPIPEHAIFEVPKISCPSRFPRSALREPQKAEQLVEAPTLVSLVEVIEQPVDIPVRAWVVLVDVFKVFSLARVPRLWSRSPTLQFLVVVSMEVPKVFTQDRVQQQSQSRSLTFQFRTVAATSKILVSHRFLQKLLEKRFKGFLALFPGGKKVRRWVRTRGRN